MGRRRVRSLLRDAAATPVAFASACAALAVVAVAAGALAVVALPAAPAAAATNRPTSLPAGQRLHVTIALRPRDPAALQAYAAAVSDPASPRYRHYLSPAAFAARFGAPAGRVRAVTAALHARGLTAGRPSAGRLSLPLTATAGALEAGAPSPLTDSTARLAAARGAIADVAGVRSVIGMDPAAHARPLAVRAPASARAHSQTAGPAAAQAQALGRADDGRSTSIGGAQPAQRPAGPRACAAARKNAAAQSAYTADQIARAYGFGGLYRAGDEGRGVTVAVYELEPNDPRDVAAYQRCMGTHAAIGYVRVHGGAGRGAGSDEAAFDIENLIGFAPRVHVLVYQGPNSNSGAPGSGPYDTFSAIVNQNRARVVSVSWGQCEAQLGAASARAESDLFAQAAIQGQSVVAASGDSGSADCNTGGPRSSTKAAVDDPASQPLVTGVGGTSLHLLTPHPVQTTWNSGGGIGAPGVAPGAGGGGVSSLWTMPRAQRETPSRLHVLRSGAGGRACGHLTGWCREVPDVSAVADPATGYEIYWNGADSEPEPSGWQGLGGTSGAAPLWAALLALADASPGCRQAPLGYAGPALYRAAIHRYASDFSDVTEGDNDFSGTTGGRWQAGTGFDPVTGLGTPNATPLVSTLCASTLGLRSLRAQSSAAGAAIALRLRFGDAHGARPRFSATHLPPGVRLDARTGQLSGSPRKPGVYHVRAQATDGQGSLAGESFTWGVGGAPRITRAAIGGGRLSVAVAAARRGPALRRLVVALPGAIGSSDAVRVLRAGAGNAAIAVHGSAATITFRRPVRAATVQLPAVAGTVSVDARAGSTGTSALSATVT